MKLNLMRLKTVVPIWSVLAIAMAQFLYGTSPDSIGPVWVTVFFVVAYLFMASSIQMCALVFIRVMGHPSWLHHWKLSYPLIISFLPVTAVGLGSLDQLVLRDILIFFGLTALIIFYVAKRGQANSSK